MARNETDNMDRNKVEQLARNHKQLAQGSDLREHADTDAARNEEARAFEQLWQQIERECAEYCASYNDVFGAVRVHFEAHTDTVVIRSHPDQQDTLVFRRTLQSDAHLGRIEAHRYHYPAHPVDLPVSLRRTAHGALTLTHRDNDVTPEDLVLELLSTFSEQLARADRRRAGAAHTAGDDGGR
jgi:hypothetical protein